MKPLIVITGPTASGKSGLALELAKRYHGEIICADSRTVYAGMDIGTAKPTVKDQKYVPHRSLDVALPNERFTVADFQLQARQAIDDIRLRGKVPFMVGGTGLYIDSIVLDYKFEDGYDEAKRKLLEVKNVEELTLLLKKQHIEKPVNMLNKRHLIRALELGNINSVRRIAPDENTYVVAVTTELDELTRRVSVRADEMFASGVVHEAEELAAKYGWDAEALTGNIYPILRKVVEGSLTVEEAKERFIIRDRQLIKRQLTWLKRHDFVHWLSLDEARVSISHVLDRTAE